MYRTLNVLLLALCLASPLPAFAESTAAADGIEVPKRSSSAERSNGRTQLALGQAAHGLVLGGEIWWLMSEDPFGDSSPGVAVLMGMGGAAAGVTASILLTPDGIERGHAGLLNSGSLWGGFVGFTASRAHYGIGRRGRIGVAMLGQAAGLGLGHLAYKLFEPTHVQTWIIDSTTFWTTALLTTGLVALDPTDFPPRRPILAGLHVWGATAGLVGGGILASTARNMSGTRLAAINLGGLLGGLTGLAVLGLAVPGDGSTAAWGFTLGAPMGFAAAGLLTRNLKQNARADDLNLSVGMTEFDDGTRGLSIGGAF